MKKQCFPIVIGLCLLCSRAAADKPLDIQTWSTRLQSIGAKYTRGVTPAQNNYARKKLTGEIGRLGQAVVKMKSTVKEVRWKNGVAEVYTEPFLPARSPLKIKRILPFELRMDEAAAAAIAPGTKIEFEGRLVFHAGRWGAVGRAMKQQQLFSVSHTALAGLPLGTYTSPDARISIGGKLYPNRW